MYIVVLYPIAAIVMYGAFDSCVWEFFVKDNDCKASLFCWWDFDLFVESAFFFSVEHTLSQLMTLYFIWSIHFNPYNSLFCPIVKIKKNSTSVVSSESKLYSDDILMLDAEAHGWIKYSSKSHFHNTVLSPVNRIGLLNCTLHTWTHHHHLATNDLQLFWLESSWTTIFTMLEFNTLDLFPWHHVGAEVV